jgi:hypothetical protein
LRARIKLLCARAHALYNILARIELYTNLQSPDGELQAAHPNHLVHESSTAGIEQNAAHASQYFSTQRATSTM